MHNEHENEKVMMVAGTLHPVHLQKCLDMIARVDRHMMGMEELKISKAKVQQCVRMIKNKSALGTDG